MFRKKIKAGEPITPADFDPGEAEKAKLAEEARVSRYLDGQFMSPFDNHLDAGGGSAVVGFDGGLRRGELTAEEIAQHKQDAKDHARAVAQQATPQAKLDRLLSSAGLSIEELRELLK